MSHYDAFADIYDEWSQDMTEDVPFYVELASEADGPIVELAVGSGRVAIPVARETGRKVIGTDRSQAMLAQAREKVSDAGVDLELREEDMRDFELEEPAALDLLPVPGAPPPADVGGPAPGLRASRRGTAAGRALCVERLRLRPDDRRELAGRLRRRPAGIPGMTEYDPTEARIDITAYVDSPARTLGSFLSGGSAVGVGRTDRRRRPRGRGALRRLRAAAVHRGQS